MKFLLDTNIVSEPLRPTPAQSILDKLRRHRGEIAIASVVWHELLFGCHRLPPSAKREAIQHYLDQVILPSIPILPYDQRCAEWHANERARMAATGKTPPFVDGQIAAVAAINGLTLVTLNMADFAHFQGVHVIDWLG